MSRIGKARLLKSNATQQLRHIMIDLYCRVGYPKRASVIKVQAIELMKME